MKRNGASPVDRGSRAVLALASLVLVVAGGAPSVATAAPPGALDVAVGESGACALLANQELTCWGEWQDTFPPGGRYTAVAAGWTTVCALRDDGTAACWGENAHMQAAPPAGPFAALDAGWYHMCGLRPSGTAECWGTNDYGQADAPGDTFTSVTAGWDRSCGLHADGTVACWGNQVDGEAPVPTGAFSQVSAGSGYACGVRPNGAVECWGGASHPGAVPPPGSFSSVRAGGPVSCAIRTDGTAVCWGSDPGGIGLDDAPEGTFSSVAVGPFRACGIHTDGTVECWGYGSADPIPTSAAAPYRYHAISPRRIVDTRDLFGSGSVIGRLNPGESRPVPRTLLDDVHITGNPRALVVNLTAVNPSEATFLTLQPVDLPEDCELCRRAPAPQTSNLNVPAHAVRANAVVVPLNVGATGLTLSHAFSIYNNSGTVDVLIDVVGWYTSDSLDQRFIPVSPSRILDTRPGPFQTGLSGPFEPAQSRVLDVAGHGGVPADATAVVLNVTGVHPTEETFLSVLRDPPVAGAYTSTINMTPGVVRPNLVVARLDPQGDITIYNNSGSVDVLADVVGYFGALGGGAAEILAPARILDTRPGPAQAGLAGPFEAGQARVLQVTGHGSVPADTVAVWMNVTAVQPTQETFISLVPFLPPDTVPSTSSLNVVPGEVAANLVLAPLDAEGRVTIYNNSGTVDLLADVVSYVPGPIALP